jgi:hypothetical protein
MSATAIIVSFVLGTANAAFCTKPDTLENTQAQFKQMFPAGDVTGWVKSHPGHTPPNIIIRGQPNYTDAINGKVVDDPATGDSVKVEPCKPFP